MGPGGGGGGGGGGGNGFGEGALKGAVSSNSKHILWSRGFRIVQMVHMPHGGQGRGLIAFLIDDIPLGAPQVAYVTFR